MKPLQIINVGDWYYRTDLRVPGLGGSRRKVVMKRTPDGRAEFMIKTFERSVGELRSEVIASNLAAAIEIPAQSVAFCDIPQYAVLQLTSPSGVCSKLFLRTREGRLEGLVHGLELLTRSVPTYNATKNRPQDYNLDTIYFALKQYGDSHGMTREIVNSFFEMVCFDALIGGTDRHHWNWAVIEKGGAFVRFAPLFDHGISLLWDIDTPGKYQRVISHSLGMQLHKAPSRIRVTSTRNGSLYDVVSVVGQWKEVDPYVIERLYDNINDLTRGEKMRHAVVDKLDRVPPQFLGGSRDPLEWVYKYTELRRIKLLEILDALRPTPTLQWMR